MINLKGDIKGGAWTWVKLSNCERKCLADKKQFKVNNEDNGTSLHYRSQHFKTTMKTKTKMAFLQKKLMFFVADLNAFLDCQMRTQYKWPHVQKISLFPCSFHVCRNPKQKPIPENIGFLLFVYNNCFQKLKLCVKSDQNNFMNSSLLLVFIRYLHSSSSLMADCKLFGSNVLNKKRL